MKLKEIIVCILLFALTILPRLYKLNNPVADWHSWRQADTAAISRNFIKEGFHPLTPRSDSYIALTQGNIFNPNRYFFAEFPLYNILTYPLYTYFGVHEAYARLVSIFAAAFTTVFLFLLVRSYASMRIAFFAALFFAILPFNIYFGRVIMPDPLYIMFSVGTLYFVSVWIKRNSLWFAVLSGLFWSGAILTKPYALILGLPIAYFLLVGFRSSLLKKINLYIFLILSFVPYFLWRSHILQHPEGMFETNWLFNQGDIRFTGAYFRWLIFERMNRLIFATGGFVLFWLGVVTMKKKALAEWFYYFWLVGIAVYFVVLARGNVTHDYYQLPLVPVGCVFMAYGIEFLLTYGKGFVQKVLNIGVALVLIVLMLAFGWYEVRGYFNINHPEIIEAGQAVDRLLPQDAKVIAPYQFDPAFLYQTNRYGWTNDDKVPRYIKEGATHLVSVNFDDNTNHWMQVCNVLEKTDKWVIIDLQNCRL